MPCCPAFPALGALPLPAVSQTWRSLLLATAVLLPLGGCQTYTPIDATGLATDIKAAAAVRASYEDGEEARLGYLRLGGRPMREEFFFSHPEAAAAGITSEFLIVHAGTSLILAFPGSKYGDDWQENFDATPVPLEGFEYLVHRGFLSAWDDVKERVFEQVRSRIEADPSISSIVVSGHRKGGAVAMLSGIDLHRAGLPVTRIVTFGAPAVTENLLPPWKTPARLREEIEASTQLQWLETVSLHYMRSPDWVHTASQLIFQSPFNIGLIRRVRDTGFIQSRRFDDTRFTESIGDPDPLAPIRVTLFQPTDRIPFGRILGHDQGDYLLLLTVARQAGFTQ